MELETSERFRKEYQELSPALQALVDRKLRYLVENWRHRSLRVRRVQGTVDLFEASINMEYRVIFRVLPGGYRLLRLGRHDVFNEL